MIRKTAAAANARRDGAVAFWTVVCLSVIVGIVALGMDGGRMMEERRKAQAAADAAALAGGGDLFLNYNTNQGTDPGGTAKAAALAAASTNGFANDGTNSVVTVNIPPTAGSFAGQAGYVEVVVQSNLKGSFSAVFTSGPLKVQARAVARGGVKMIGLLALKTSGSDAVSLSGNASISVVGGPVLVDSTNAAAFQASGNASISAPYYDFAGALPTSRGNMTGTAYANVPATPDPLSSLAAPSLRDSVTKTVSGSLAGVTLQPGTYAGGLSLSGNDTVTLAAGVYILNGGGLQVSGNATLTGDGVMIYNTGGASAGSISITGNGKVTLTPPTTGTYAGISIFQDRDVSSAVQISGNGTVQISGTIYAPAATVQISGNGSSTNTVGGGFIASQVQVSGNGSFSVNQGTSARPRIPDVGLVE